MSEKGELTLGGTPRVAQPHMYFALESEEMIRRGDLREAIEHCRRGLIFYPENISGYVVLANASLLLDDTERAINVLLDGHRRTGAAELKNLADALLSPPASDAFSIEELHITDIVPGINDEDEDGGVWSITDDEVPSNRESVEEIVADDTSLFEEEVEPVTRDLFTGEPLDDGPLSFRVEKAEKLISVGTHRSVDEIVDAVEEVEEKVSSEEAPEEEESEVPANHLSLHSGTPISNLRSRNLRLIPGLEYAPLRKDDTSPRFAPLVEDRNAPGSIPMPRLQTRTTPPQASPPALKPEPGTEARKKSVAAIRRGDEESMTPLEELARRLESARIPAVEKPKKITQNAPDFEPSLVSDTFAAILVSQGAYAEAIKAYQMLARLKPDRCDEYEKKIAEVKWSMGNVTDA